MMRIILIAIIAIVPLAIIFEIRGWRNGTRNISKYQKGYRLATAVVLEALFIMVLFSDAFISKKNPLLAIEYWTIAIALAFILIALALLDIRATLASYLDRRREVLAGLLNEKRQKE